MWRRSRVPIALACWFVALSSGEATAQTSESGPPVLYRLEKGSTYQIGCFPPCECPLIQEVPVRGTFVLTPAGSDPLFTDYEITDVNWTASLGDPELRITGSGTYRIGGEFALQQQLSLDLQVGAEATQHFDSGLVTGPAPFPTIAITLSIHGQYCFDTVIRLNASPVPIDQIQPYRLVSGSTFQQGCFGPCLCALGKEEPIRGTFALVPLGASGVFSEFAVVNVDWVVAASTDVSRTEIPVRGFGAYRLAAGTAEQQLALDLTVGSEPLTHYDSGLVAGGENFPRIDARISINGEYCFDSVIDMHAAPKKKLRVFPAATP